MEDRSELHRVAQGNSDVTFKEFLALRQVSRRASVNPVGEQVGRHDPSRNPRAAGSTSSCVSGNHAVSGRETCVHPLGGGRGGAWAVRSIPTFNKCVLHFEPPQIRGSETRHPKTRHPLHTLLRTPFCMPTFTHHLLYSFLLSRVFSPRFVGCGAY